MTSSISVRPVDRSALIVVIVTFNSSRTIGSCLDSLLEHCAKDPQASIIVVDNASTDDTWEKVESRRSKSGMISALRLPTNVGFGSACNVAFRKGSSYAYVLINPDCRFDGDSLWGLVEFLRANPLTAIVGLSLVNPDGTPQSSAYDFSSWYKSLLQLLWIPAMVRALLSVPGVGWALRRLPLGREFVRLRTKPSGDLAAGVLRPPLAPRKVDWVTGAAMVLRADFLEVCGGFDERIFLYGEDEDICRRAHSSGWSVVAIDSTPIVHELGWRRNRRDENLAEIKYRSLRYVVTKHHGNSLQARVMLAALPVQVFGCQRALRRLLGQ